jgi:hypothetical protein
LPDPLRKELQALARDLQARDVPLIVGGGYGLLLRTELIRSSDSRTLIPDLPTARSTEDLDIFLKAEVISNPDKTDPIREALDRRGYEPVAKYFQFQREVDYLGSARKVKVDFLAAPVPDELSEKVKADNVRLRPRGGKGLHAHVTPEALTVEESLITVDIGEGDESLAIYLPHPFSYLLLKLYALRDRLHDEGMSYGRHHAFDLYATIAMMTETEWEECLRLKQKHEDAPRLIEAHNIATNLFADTTAIGALRLREHIRSTGYDLSEEQLNVFLETLHEILNVDG